MRRGFKCKKDVLEILINEYDALIEEKYSGDFLKGIKDFERIAEKELRKLLDDHYETSRSRDQAWKTCKGAIYEYAVYKYLQNLLDSNKDLKRRFDVVMGEEAILSYREQVAIKNWADIYPDADILMIDRENKLVKAIISCKTSLRERLTETAFWKRELEKTKDDKTPKIIFITTDKDNELKVETNRYIILHVIDYTFITDPDKYDELVNTYKKKYGNREDFDKLISKIMPIEEFDRIFEDLLQ